MPRLSRRKDCAASLGRIITATWTGLPQRRSAARQPKALWPEAQSAIVFAMSYGQGLDAFERLERKSQGVISVYALNRDYHDVVKGKLKKIATWFASIAKAEVKVFVDTAPLMEKPLAHAAGLGWQGKHTNLRVARIGVMVLHRHDPD